MLNPSIKSCVMLRSTHHRVKLEVHFGEDLLIFHVPVEDLDALGATLTELPDSTNILTSILARGCRRERGGIGVLDTRRGGARVLDTRRGRGWVMDTRRERGWDWELAHIKPSNAKMRDLACPG